MMIERTTMNAPAGIVYVLDDEPGMVKALRRLLQESFEVRGFTSVRSFLEAWRPDEPACLVLDVAMPDLDGLELQQRLNERGMRIPIIFLTGHGDIPMSVRAIKAGATDFLTKPVDAAVLEHAVQGALQAARMSADLTARVGTLTPRERQVMEQVVAGKLNKQIAAEFGTGEHTIKVHRAQVMKKMGVESLADLVRAVERLRLGK